jgi:cyclopropane-fatty-acyl-phospholipid synthase
MISSSSAPQEDGAALVAAPAVVPARSSRRATWYRSALIKAFAAMQRGHLRLELPDGGALEFGSADDAANRRLALGLSPRAHLKVHREAFFRKCFWSGDIGFSESYIDGDWETPDLTALIAFFVLNVEDAPTLSGSRRAMPSALNLLRFVNRVGHLLRPNTRTIARRNIREHYDLSNDFFALWLDPSMMYSSARWPAGAPELTLEAAQREKNEALCRKLRLQPSDHVLEIGTGWGGWALHAASTHGCRVTTVTISQQQYELARQRVAAAGLNDRVEVQLCDFRDIRGQFDKIVSIEMIEALGHRYQATFTDVVARLLKPGGLLALQFITCPDARYEELRRGVDFIQKHIFPGSLLLSVNRLNGLLARSGGFVLHGLDDFGVDYARTLGLWRERFHARRQEVLGLGFDERFLRKWTYYLCYCEAAFALRNISVVHTLHTRANNVALDGR